MTKTQARLLAFIRDYIAKHGYSPMLKEMAAGIGVGSRHSALGPKAASRARIHRQGPLSAAQRSHYWRLGHMPVAA